MTTKISVMIPARNEVGRIEPTIEGLKQINDSHPNLEMNIVLVDDGSKDDTAEIVESMGVSVVKREDRGYSALGKPELAETHNSGFDYIEENYPDYNYIMVVGADTTFEEGYIDKLLQEFDENPNLVMAAGRIEGTVAAKTAVRGSGRLIKGDYWKEIGARLPTKYYSWESYPIIMALSKGYETKTVQNAIMYTMREPLALVDWKRYGIQMKEMGYIWIYVLARSFGQFSQLKFKRGFRLIQGYIFGKCERYPKEIRNYMKKTQYSNIWNRLKFWS